MNKQTDGIRIIHTSNLQEAERLVKEGWEPVECSIDGQSVVSRLQMDHHGKLSHLEGVAIRAYRDHFGACANGKTQGFVVTGVADADACFAIAALAGMLPHPSKRAELEALPEKERPPGWLIDMLSVDLMALADIVNKIDTELVRYYEQMATTPEGHLLLLWNQMKSDVNDRSSFHAGVDRWRLIAGTRPPKALIAAVGGEEDRKVRAALNPTRTYSPSPSSLVTAVDSPEDCFNAWYGRYTPCVVHLKADGEIDIGVRDHETAMEMFGPRGLQGLFGTLDAITGKGWGGHPWVCGGPRGVRRTWEEAIEIANVVSKAVQL